MWVFFFVQLFKSICIVVHQAFQKENLVTVTLIYFSLRVGRRNPERMLSGFHKQRDLKGQPAIEVSIQHQESTCDITVNFFNSHKHIQVTTI